MIDEMNLAPVPQELAAQKAELEEDRLLDRMQGAVAARLESEKQSAQARAAIRTRPLLLPPKPLSRARGRR